jgi:hypothetical protein
MRTRLESLPLDSSALGALDSMEAQVQTLPQALWPSEIAAITNRARQLRSAIGAQ